MMIAPTIHDSPKSTGCIEVISGCMFSGKTEELIRRAEIARQTTRIFKPNIDERYSPDHIVSHSDIRVKASVVEKATDILALVDEVRVVGIDEGQFFDMGLVDVAEALANSGRRVIIAGLDQDYLGKPFEPMPQLLAVAEYITKTLAICVSCGNPADKTQRKLRPATNDPRLAERVLVGKTDLYEARCRQCFDPPLSRK